MYTQSAKYYDALYRALGKDYQQEAVVIERIAAERCRSGGNDLLDAGCGTGAHMQALSARFACDGLDVNRSMLDIARARNPDSQFFEADMIGFNLGKKYDVITCLFGSIGYLPNMQRLEQTLQTFARHLKPGGAVIIEPWILPAQWRDGHVSALYVDEPELKVARMSVSRRDGSVSILNFHYMVASTDGIRTFTEAHRLTLFTAEQYGEAFRRAGLFFEFSEDGITPGRGLYVGFSRPL
ncbi:MAG: class I SAM-dependent methyltransferase [Candidatus Baltobacteraceae bacterium]